VDELESERVSRPLLAVRRANRGKVDDPHAVELAEHEAVLVNLQAHLPEVDGAAAAVEASGDDRHELDFSQEIANQGVSEEPIDSVQALERAAAE